MRYVLVVVLAGCQTAASFDGFGFGGNGGGRSGLGHTAAGAYRAQLGHPAPPITLAPSDGSELALVALDAKVAITGPLAATELHLTFRNTEARVREGRFAITLPPGATVDRFALLVDGAWREARAVSRERGRAVYETYLQHGVDPALLEADAGNQFSARVFPIPAKADKELVIGYTQRVAATEPYTLPLRGLPAIGNLAVTIDKDGVTSGTIREYSAPEDIVVGCAATSSALASGDAFVARVDLNAERTPMPIDKVAILVDTSASRAPIMARQAALVAHLVGALPSGSEVVVAAYDQDVTEIFRGKARDFDPRGATDQLLEHGALGASDLGGALARAASFHMPRLVIVGDGIVTLGEHEPSKLAALARPFERVDAIEVGTSVDRDTLAAVVHGGKLGGAIVDGSIATRVMRPLSTAVAPEQVIEVEGAAASWPLTTRGIAPGEPVFVLGLRDRTLGAAPLAIRIGTKRITVAPHAADEQLVRRTVARAQVADLTERMQRAADADRPALAKQIETIALQYGIVSSQTSLIVLETDADEHRMLDPKPASQVAFERFEQPVEYFRTAPRIDLAEVRSSLTVPAGEAGIKINLPQGREQLPPEPPVELVQPYEGKLADVMAALAKSDRAHALDTALRWQLTAPGDLAALIALGESLEASGQAELAARAYGSILDLYPNRAELARAAGERFDRIGATALAIDAYERALRERPDHVGTYRLLAYALVRAGRHGEALDRLLEGRTHTTRDSIKRILTEDAGLVAAAIIAKDPAQRSSVTEKLGSIAIPTTPSLRIVLQWETDANDVDLHIYDRAGAHAWYETKHLASGGDLLDDITTGFGPEMVVIERPAAFPYKLAAHYFRKGPMGLGLGTAQVIRHDGAGHLTVEDRPFVIQVDDAHVDLGTVTR